jgi:hypothetical protein
MMASRPEFVPLCGKISGLAHRANCQRQNYFLTFLRNIWNLYRVDISSVYI